MVHFILDSTDSCYRFFCTGGQEPQTNRVIPTRSNVGCISEFFGSYYAEFIIQNYVRFVVVLIYLGYICCSIWGCINLKVGLEVQNLVPRDSTLITELNMEDRFFANYAGFAYVVIDAALPYHRPEMRALVLHLYHAMAQTEYTEPGEFWLQHFPFEV